MPISEENLKWARRFLKRINVKYKFQWEVYYEVLNQYLRNAKVWVDAGCGRNEGVFLYGRGKIAVGLDLRIHPRLLDHRLVIGNIYHLPFRRGSLDTVSASWVLEHIENIETAFLEISRVLKRGGHFVAIVPNINSLTVSLARILPKRIKDFLLTKLYDVDEGDVFPAFYRFNNVRRIKKGYKGLKCVKLIVHQDVAVNRRWLFLCMLSYDQLINILSLRRFKSNLTFVYTKV
jgi:SAM-dependent methyltransferase